MREGENILDLIDLGVRRGIARALAEHKKAGRAIAIWQDGKVVMIPPEEIPDTLPEESEPRRLSDH